MRARAASCSAILASSRRARSTSIAFDLDDCLLHSAERAVLLGNDFDAPATTFGEAGVHAVKIRGKNGGFVAAGAAANLNDGRTVVERVVGNECGLYLFQ